MLSLFTIDASSSLAQISSWSNPFWNDLNPIAWLFAGMAIALAVAWIIVDIAFILADRARRNHNK